MLKRLQRKILHFRKDASPFFNIFTVFILASSLLVVSFMPSQPLQVSPLQHSENSLISFSDWSTGQILVDSSSHSVQHDQFDLNRLHKRRRSRRVLMAMSFDTRLPVSLASEKAMLLPPELEPVSLHTEPSVRPPAFV